MSFELEIGWRFNDDGDRSDVPRLLFALLDGIESGGTLTAAAERNKVSYRTAWNLVNDWSDRLGGELLVSRRGSGAVLSPLGEKVLWMQRYAMEESKGLRHDVDSVVAAALKQVGVGREGLKICASHCFSHDVLRQLFKSQVGSDLVIENAGSARSLALLQAGECDVAGFHLSGGVLKASFLRAYQPFITGYRGLLMAAVRRKQGLIVKRGNPKGIFSMRGLLKAGVRMVNRQAGSGTRLLLDALLLRERINGGDILGYEDIEYTHSAVSALVAGGSVDVAVGTEVSAAQFGLDFVPLEMETYYYAIRQEALELPVVRGLQGVLASDAWRNAVAKMEGYYSGGSGEVMDMGSVFS